MIFSNTTPFIALSAIGRLQLLPALFERIHVVEPVVRECAAGGPVKVPALESRLVKPQSPDRRQQAGSTPGTRSDPILFQHRAINLNPQPVT